MAKMRIVHIYGDTQVVDGQEVELYVDMDSGQEVFIGDGVCGHCSTPLIFLDADHVAHSVLYHDANCPTTHLPRIQHWEAQLLKTFREQYGYDTSKVYA